MHWLQLHDRVQQDGCEQCGSISKGKQGIVRNSTAMKRGSGWANRSSGGQERHRGLETYGILEKAERSSAAPKRALLCAASCLAGWLPLLCAASCLAGCRCCESARAAAAWRCCAGRAGSVPPRCCLVVGSSGLKPVGQALFSSPAAISAAGFGPAAISAAGSSTPLVSAAGSSTPLISAAGCHSTDQCGRLPLHWSVRPDLVRVGHGHDSEPAGGRVVLLLLQNLHVAHIQPAGCTQVG